jgi:putative ABC transport system permease protein
VKELPKPRVSGLRLTMLAHVYRLRLRSHAVQELLAGSGIAVGVALVLGVLVANTSITGSAGELAHQVVGSATLQIAARSPEGFGAPVTASAVRRLPGVAADAAILRQGASVVGPHGRASIQLLGVSDSIVRLGSLRASGFGPGGLNYGRGLILPAAVAAATGAEPGTTVSVLARGRRHAIVVGAVLPGDLFGVLGSSPVAIAPLPVAQRLDGLGGRVSALLVRARPGANRRVETELRSLAGGRLDVVPADNELALLNEAVRPNNQSTSLFAAISVMVGFLLALNAMLLTVPERRRFVADLRLQGYDWRQIVALLGFQALVLGMVASAAGILLGLALSDAFLEGVPAYLVAAFPLGSSQAIGVGTILLALGCGVLATALASLSPILDLRPSRPTDAVLRDRAAGSEVISPRTTVRLASAGASAVVAIVALVLAFPGATIFGGVALALATLGLIPSTFAGIGRALRWLGERVRSSSLVIVSSELGATTTRAVALAGIAGLAVYGSVAIGGARADLTHGLDVNFGEYLQTADVWVTTGGNDLTTNPFDSPGAQATLASSPLVASVRAYGGSFLDVGTRRLWIIGRPPQDRPLIPASQLLSGSAASASARLRAGGWAAISSGFAGERHLAVGRSFSLPTPSGPASFRVAAVLTNLGWAPGAVILGAGEYRRVWGTVAPSALEITLRPGVRASTAAAAISRLLAPWPGLGVQTVSARQRQYAADSRQGLRALSQISELLLIAAALAVASALSAALWQRRVRLAALKIQGYGSGQLWRAMLLESAVVLGAGCLVGGVAGVVGHALATRWLRLSTGFPAPFSLGLGRVFLTLGVLGIIAIAVISLPGLIAARTPARTSLQE